MPNAALEQFQKLTSTWPEKKPEDQQEKEKPKEDRLSILSDREREIVEGVMASLDFGVLLVEDFMEADVPLRDGLVIRFRSPRANAAFLYQEYLTKKNQNKDFSETANHKVLWALANGLVSVNGAPFMPGAGLGHVEAKMDRLMEKSKHVLDQFIWAHNLFDFALREVCDSDGSDLAERLKNS
jgi:hypothetical protein